MAFGDLISKSPFWVGTDAGVVSVNTQARRLGCLTYLTGKVARGRKVESLLFALSKEEIADLKQNIRDGGGGSGELTQKQSSVEHYLDTAIQLRLLAKQGSVLNLTGKGQFLIDIVRPHAEKPYPLSEEAKIFFQNLLLRADYFGLAAVISCLLRGSRKLVEIQKEYKAELLRLLQGAVRSSSDSRLHRMAQDRMLAIRNWTKPESYAEHLVSAKVNWFIDLGIINGHRTSSEVEIAPAHRAWLADLASTTIPTEAQLIAHTLNYAKVIAQSLISQNQQQSECDLLQSLFTRFAPRGNLQKVRCGDAVLFFMCFHSETIFQRVAAEQKLFSNFRVECGSQIYHIHTASRATQAFIVRNQLNQSTM